MECIEGLVGQYWKRKWEKEHVHRGFFQVPQVRRAKYSKKLDAVSYESQFRKRFTKVAIEGVEVLREKLLKKSEKEWRQEADHRRIAIDKPLSILDTAIAELKAQQQKELEAADDPLFTWLMREMFLQLKGHTSAAGGWCN